MRQIDRLSNRQLSNFYLLFYLLNAPLFALYGLMPFILYKDLHASPLQITVLVSVKPIVAVFSSYWSHRVTSGRDHISNNILGATLLGLLPVLCIPFISSPWLLVAVFGLYFFAERAVIPAWMELLKISLPESQQSKVVSKGSLIMFLASAAFPIFISPLMDLYTHCWRWIFPILCAVSFIRIPILLRLPTISSNSTRATEENSFLAPWRGAWKILRTRVDFAYFQLIFFCGGLGLMVMQPALPYFVEDNLHLSYTEIAFAIALCKGIGFALTTPIWSTRLHKSNIFKFCGAVCFFAACSVALVLLSKFIGPSIYVAFLVYGAMQAGSQLSWQLGGPIFSPRNDSSGYSSVNIMLVGIRGFVGPAMGGLIFSRFGAPAAFMSGTILCFFGAGIGYLCSKKIPLLTENP